MTRLACPALCLLASLAVPALARAKLDRTALTAIVQQEQKRWGPPGLAVAVVHGDEVHLLGTGVRAMGGDDPVTPDTIFAFASLTKAFTAAAVGLLVEDGKVGWDDPVRRHLDWFRLADPLADREVRLRDLLCHRWGVGGHDLLWYRAPWSVEESVRRLAFLEPQSSFRSRYQYCNLGYLACGLAVERAAGTPWHTFVQKRLLDPLGMRHTVFTSTAARAHRDHATPHRRNESGRWVSREWYPDESQIRAAGSLKGSVRDLSAWLRLQLGGGIFAGRRLLAAATVEEMHTPQVVVPLDRATARRTGTTQQSYGLGWRILDHRGHRLVEHGGANDGFRARVVLAPDAKVGVAVLTNCEDAGMVGVVSTRLLDRLLGLPEQDGHAVPGGRAPSSSSLPLRKPGTNPSRELAAYTGTYQEPAYGKVVVKLDGKGLVLAWSSFRVSLRHHHFDTFATTGSDRLEGQLATFALGADGEVERVQFLGRTFRRTAQPG